MRPLRIIRHRWRVGRALRQLVLAGQRDQKSSRDNANTRMGSRYDRCVRAHCATAPAHKALPGPRHHQNRQPPPRPSFLDEEEAVTVVALVDHLGAGFGKNSALGDQ